MYYAKLYRQKSDVLLAVCDVQVYDKTFDNGSLSFHVDPCFYGKEAATEEELLGLFGKANIINLAGDLCIDLAIRAGIVDPGNVLDLGGCRHAQVVRI